MSDRSAAWAIFGVFFFESSAIGQWIPRIPDIKDALMLSDGQLGLALLAMPLGTLIGFSIAGRIMQSLGLRTACRIFLPLWALLFITPALASTLVQLMLALVVSGLAIGMIETAMNTEAARIEKAAGKRLMSRCHGFWSLGTMIGALIGGLIAQQGVSVAMHFVIVMPLIALGGYFVATALPDFNSQSRVQVSMDEVLSSAGAEVADARTQTTDSTVNADAPLSVDDGLKEPSLFTIPSKAILLLCITPLGISMVEGAFIDWSAVFMRDVMTASPLLIAVTYSFFAVVMSAVRLSGDAITERFGDVTVVRVSGVAATVGIAVFALAPSTLWVFVGAAIAGAGVAIVFPLTVTAAANRPGRSAAENVAALNMIAFTAFLISPPLIGFLSESTGLRYALLALAPIAFTTFLLADQVKQSTDQTSIK